MTSLFPSLFEAVVFWGILVLWVLAFLIWAVRHSKKGAEEARLLALERARNRSRDSNRIRAHRRASELAVLSGRNTNCRWKLFRALVNVAFGPLNYIGRLSNQPSSKSVHQGDPFRCWGFAELSPPNPRFTSRRSPYLRTPRSRLAKRRS